MAISKDVITMKCRKCGSENELPFLFCTECGNLRRKLNRFQVTANISLAVSALLGTYYFGEYMEWPWPLFALFALLFLQLGLWLGASSRRGTFRLFLWLFAFMAGSGFFFHIMVTEGPLLFVFILQDTPKAAEQHPWLFFPVIIAFIVAFFIPMYGRWGRRYGWVNAYRLVLLTLLGLSAAALLASQLLLLAFNNDWIPPTIVEPVERFLVLSKPKYDHLVGGVASVLFRVFLFEIFVFASVRGYAIAHKDAKKHPLQHAKEEGGLTRSLVGIASFVRQTGQALENMVRYLGGTLVELARDLSQVMKAFVRELAGPIIALSVAGLYVYQLAIATYAYIAAPKFNLILSLLAIILILSVCELVAIGCKTRFRWKRLVAFHAQLMGWLLPNMLLFFVLISLSLALAAKLMNTGDPDIPELPYYIGPLTQILGSLLVAMIVIVLVRKRESLFAPAREEERLLVEDMSELPESDAADEEDGVSGEFEHPRLNKAGRRKKSRVAARSRNGEDADREAGTLYGIEDVRKSLLGTAGSAISKLPWNDKARTFAKGMQERMAGKPPYLIRLAEVRQALETRQTQLENLEATRGSVSHNTYAQMSNNLEKEILDLETERDRHIAQANIEYEDKLAERKSYLARMEQARDHLAELRTLRKNDAISSDDFERRSSSTRQEIERVSFLLDHCEKLIVYLEAEIEPDYSSEQPGQNNSPSSCPAS